MGLHPRLPSFRHSVADAVTPREVKRDGRAGNSMRKLVAITNLRAAVVGGILLTAACTPYLLGKSPDPTLAAWRVGLLLPVATALLLMAIAWTHFLPQGDAASAVRPFLLLLFVGTVLEALHSLLIAPMLAALRPDYYASTLTGWIVELPWLAVFQPLVLVAGVYAVVFRLSRRAGVAIAAVVLVRQLAAWNQWQDSLGTLQIILVLVMAGAQGLLLGVAYRRLGFPMLVVLGVLTALRGVARL